MANAHKNSKLEELLTEVVELNGKVMAMRSGGGKVTYRQMNKVVDALKAIIKAIKDFFELEVKTIIRGEEQSSYVTTVKVDGDVESTFPKQIDSNIFSRHNALLDSAWQVRKTIVEKIVEIIIAIIKAIGGLP